MEPHNWDAIVIGGGAAGLSAALMLGRARRRTLVIDAGSPRNRFAAHMNGVLGHDGIPPGDLLARGRLELERYGVEVVPGTVAAVTTRHDGLSVTLSDGVALSARALIVAGGLADELPSIPGVAEQWGRGVLHCPYCHGWEVRDRTLGVLLVSEAGLHQAELVRQWSADVVVFTGNVGLLQPETEQRLRARGIRIVAEPVTEVIGDGTNVSAVRLDDGRELAIDALFTAGTPRPFDGFLAPLSLERSETLVGSFIAVDAGGRTSNPRVWAAGNVVAPMATVPVAIGAGATAGGAANAFLVSEEFDIAVRALTSEGH